MTVAAAEPGRLDIARVIQQTFEVLSRNFATFLVLALILVGAPSLLLALLEPDAIQRGLGTRGFGVSTLTSSILSVVTNAILQGALIYGTVQDLNGKPANVTESLANGLRQFLPLIGLSILEGVAVVIGFALFIVPGVMMACAWAVAVPALVAERRGIFDSFSRSAELTRGNRWRILALFLIYVVIALALTIVASIVGGLGGAAASLLTGINPITAVVSAAVSALTALISSAAVAVLYVELRHVREGAGPDWLAEIFA